MRDAVKRKDAKVAENKFLSSPGEIGKRFIMKVFWADGADDIRCAREPQLLLVVEDNDGLSPLGWKPPKPLARGGATKEAETHEHPPDHEDKTGDDAAVAVDGIETPPLVPAPAQQVVDVEEIDVDEKEWVAAGGDGGSGGGGADGGGGDGSGGGGGGGETAAPDPIIPRFVAQYIRLSSLFLVL
ncbi:unnamed protein product [Ectocarpus sp. CCAP 1310/34]|nr:unnamed protein product [Ectocarpus sp. CCAP 1310/34]